MRDVRWGVGLAGACFYFNYKKLYSSLVLCLYCFKKRIKKNPIQLNHHFFSMILVFEERIC